MNDIRDKFTDNIIIQTMNNQNLQCTEQILNQFNIYYEFLVEYNNNVNLTAITEKKDVYVKHFMDSILGQRYIKKNSTICDIGTGAGFPGVVLKIVRPDIKLVLVDSLNKRVEFLNLLLKKLNIIDVNVLHYRAEDVEFKNKYLNSFDCVVARAVAGLNTLTEYCLPFVKKSGKFIAYKGKDAENETVLASRAINLLGGKLSAIENDNLDDDTKRYFVIIDKIAETNNKYPRSQNKPKLKPL